MPGNAPPEFVRFLRDQMDALGPVECRRFFGGWEFRLAGTQFAMMIRDTLYLRVDDALRQALIAAGSTPFSYSKRARVVVVERYYTAPEACLDDHDALVDWAGRAFGACAPGMASDPST